MDVACMAILLNSTKLFCFKGMHLQGNCSIGRYLDRHYGISVHAVLKLYC